MTTATKFSYSEKPTTVSSEACRFDASPLEFKESEGDKESILHPISFIARTPNVVNHWYWGRCVHDLDGVKIHKDSIAVDYCHNENKVIGFCDKFDVDHETGLRCDGAIVKQPGIAQEVVTNGTNKVPYESSVYFDRGILIIEYVEEGATTEVNGFAFEGPGVVFREWVLRGVAVCPYGQDMDAVAQFSDSNPTVTLSYKEPEMGDKNDGGASQETAALQKRIDELEAKFAASTGQPTDLPSAMERIEELESKNQDLETKLSEASKPDDGDGNGGDGDGQSGGDVSIETRFAQLEEKHKQLEAKFSHQGSSSDDPATGDGDGDGEENVSWSSNFKFAAGQAKK